MNDFSTPRRMSPAAFIVIWMQTFQQLITTFIVIIGMMLFDDELVFSQRLIMAVAFVGGAIALSAGVAFLKYYFRTYHIEGDSLIYTHGIAFKNTTSVPLERIHNLRTKSGIFYRLVDMRGVSFDTLASEKQEVELILNESEWQALLRQVRIGEDYPNAGDPDTAVAPPPPFRQETLQVSNLNIIKGALCQNHLQGFAILGAIAAAVFNKVSEIDEDATGQIIDYIDAHAGEVSLSVGQILLCAAVIYLFVMLLWTGRTAIRYYGMTINIADSKLTFESGLFSRYTSRIARNKATVLSIKQNPLERLAQCETIAIHQAENVTDEKKRGDITIYGSDLGNRILGWWTGDDTENELPFRDKDSVKESILMTARSGKGVFVRRFIPHLLIAVVALLVLMFAADIVMPAIAACTLYTVLMAVRAVMAWRHSSIELTDAYVLINRGNIARIREYVRYPDIESIRIRRTPFTRYTGRVSLQLATNSGATTVYSLTLADARTLRSYFV